MRHIDSIIIHCSATKPGAHVDVKVIDEWHRQRGWKGVGYHFVILEDGTVQKGRPISEVGAHCKGWNERSIGICYVGGLDATGKAADTRTKKQRRAMRRLVCRLLCSYPDAEVLGHRDTSPDLNGDGRITPDEYLKECPCFDVKRWMRGVRLWQWAGRWLRKGILALIGKKG